MRDQVDEIRKRGAELAIVGNGATHFAAAFREDFELDGPLLVDPELRAYRAAGLRRGRVEILSPRLLGAGLRATRAGYRQTSVEGDPWQLGGVFVIRPGGALAYRFASRDAGDHAPIEEILAALEPGAPEVAEEAPRSELLASVSRAVSLIADPLIVPSFDRGGFRLHALAFDPDDLEVDLTGRRCLVTGANSGIGYETALALADLGAEVLLLCRSPERGAEAAERIATATGNAKVRCETVDLSDLASIRDFATRLDDAPVDVLVHNAGVLPEERAETKDGLELCFATHVAGPHLLTRLLRGRLEASTDARVVWVSSGGMYTRRLQVEDPGWRDREDGYNGVLAYAETKRAQVVLAEMWARELEGTKVCVNAMHPGWADTPAVRSSLPRFHRVTSAILRSPAEGADTVVWLAAAGAASGLAGRFVFDREPRRTHLLPGTRESEEERDTLWQLCEEIAEAAGDRSAS